MLDYVKQYAVYVIGVLIICALLYMWHEKDKEVDALHMELNNIKAVLQQREQDNERESKATNERDEKYDILDKGLSDIQSSLRKIQRDNAEIRRVLAITIPAESLRGLHSYTSSNDKAASTGAPAASPVNTK